MPDPVKKEVGPQSDVNRLLGHISAYERKFAKWERRVDRIIKRYRDEERPTGESGAKFNVLWSNIQTLIPTVFAKIPKPDVARRFTDPDPVARVASLILERALEYETEHYPDFVSAMRSTLLDRFLGGRGVAWARYEPHMKTVPGVPEDGVEVTEDADDPPTNEILDYECAPTDYVHWKDFGHSQARTWEEVTLVWRRVFMTRESCIERFGKEKGAQIPLDSRPEDYEKQKTADTEESFRACIFEFWDKENGKAYWLAKSISKIVDERDDPMKLEGFFPCPKPLFATLTNDSLVPIPDYTLYQDQAKELDILSDRIRGLIEALQVKGVYDASIPSLARIFTEGANGTLIPVENWAAFAEKNGLSGAIDIVDLKPIYEALKVCYDSMRAIMQQIYDLTGLADIIRGQSEASETAAAQKIKSQYASLRLRSMQRDVASFASEMLQLKAQIICGKFSPETILKIAAVQQLAAADQQLVQPAMQLLLGDRIANPESDSPNPTRNFRITVNADTMVEMDREAEKSSRMEFLQAQAMFMEKAMPMLEKAPQVAPLVASLWKFSLGAFPVGKTVEGEFDAVIDKLKNMPPPQPKPDPEMMRAQNDAQVQQARAQADAQAEQAKLAAQAQETQQRNMLEQQRARDDAMFARFEALLKARTAIEVAEIGAKATMSQQQEQAAEGATNG